MVSFITTSKACVLSAVVASSGLFVSASNLRTSSASHRELQGLQGDNWFCETFALPFVCDTTGPQCPEVAPLNATAFDLDAFIEKSWFIQKQQINPYQSEDQLYCIVATYNKTDTDFIDVSNYGNNGQVNGPPQNSDNNGFFSNLCAKQVNGGELAVAPCLFGPIFDFVAGPYWVLDAGRDENGDYSWAIVSGGQPDQLRQSPTDPTKTVCTTKEGSSFFDTNGSGLWLFTRERNALQGTIDAMETRLLEMGVFPGDLKKVNQTGCNYDGATLKE